MPINRHYIKEVHLRFRLIKYAGKSFHITQNYLQKKKQVDKYIAKIFSLILSQIGLLVVHRVPYETARLGD